MIKSFDHSGLKRFFETENKKGIPQDMAARIRLRLDVIDAARQVEEINISGWDLHPLTGNRKGTWAVKVTKNYRITFKFQNSEASHVNLEDYH